MTDEKNKVKSEQGDQRAQVKRPMNAFMLWSKEKRRKISSVDPSLHNSHISKILGEEWKTLPLKEKDPYIRESKTLMEKHKIEHPDYHYKPRQNKLTKALKELSSLHSSLSSTGGCTSTMKPFSMPRYMLEKNRYEPYRGLERRISYEREGEYSDVLHRPISGGVFSGPQSCHGCTCKLQCSENVGYHSFYQYRCRLQSGCEEMRPCHQEKPGLFERAWNLPLVPSTRNIHYMPSSPNCGWSVPVLVNFESKEPRKDTRCTEGPKGSANRFHDRVTAQETDYESEDKA